MKAVALYEKLQIDLLALLELPASQFQERLPKIKQEIIECIDSETDAFARADLLQIATALNAIAKDPSSFNLNKTIITITLTNLS